MLAEIHAGGKVKSKPPRVKWKLQIAWYRPIRTWKGKWRRHKSIGWCDKESRSGCMVKVGLWWVYGLHTLLSVTLLETGKQPICSARPVSKIKIVYFVLYFLLSSNILWLTMSPGTQMSGHKMKAAWAVTATGCRL